VVIKVKSRKERRTEARQNKTEFQPEYNNGVRFSPEGKRVNVGGAPKSYEEAMGIGYERYNNKFVTIKEKPTDGNQ
jgi:hypothetical protein